MIIMRFAIIFFLLFSFNSWAVSISFKNTDIRVFIDVVSDLMNKNFIIDPTINGNINLTVKQNLTNKQFYQLFLATLKAHNYTAIEGINGFIKIIPIAKIKQYLPPALTKVFKLNYISGKDLLSVIKKSILINKNDLIRHSLSFNKFTNAIVVTGSTSYINNVANLISSLDAKKQQVLIEAVIFEISESNAKKLGAQLLVKGKHGMGSFNFNNLLSLLLAKTANVDLPVGAIIGIDNFNNNSGLGVVVNALSSFGNINILSTPSIVTLDDKLAKIIVGHEVPIIISSQVKDKDNNLLQNYTRKDIGLKLMVKPVINNKSSITLDINLEMSYLLPSSNAVDVITSKRQIKTAVNLQNNQILVLGGLIDDTFKDVKTSIPLLGDLPIVGSLFTRTEQVKEKRNLVVFMRATILSADTANKLSNDKYQQITKDNLIRSD